MRIRHRRKKYQRSTVYVNMYRPEKRVLKCEKCIFRTVSWKIAIPKSVNQENLLEYNFPEILQASNCLKNYNIETTRDMKDNVPKIIIVIIVSLHFDAVMFRDYNLLKSRPIFQNNVCSKFPKSSRSVRLCARIFKFWINRNHTYTHRDRSIRANRRN